MSSLWLLLAEAENADDNGDWIIGLIYIGTYAVIGLAFIVGIVWAFFSRRRRESQQDKFEDRDN